MTVFRRATHAVLLGALVVVAMPVLAQAPAQSGASAPTDSQVRELQEPIKSLQQQLDKLDAAQDPSSRRSMMEQNWRGMQDYMGRMHERWGMGDPWMMGPGMTGCPMMGGGAEGGGAAWWPLPEGVTPESYRQQMLDHMGRMQEQMNKIAQTTDPKERQRLMEEHWRTMYQDMQTMRGMGWMWEGPMMGGGMMRGTTPGRPAPSASPLPDADSAGAKLISTYCTQCHAAPQPTLHTAAEWASVTQRMHARMSGGWTSVKTPTEQEMQTIVAYMQKHAR